MLADLRPTRQIKPYSDERIREKMIDNDYAPFTEDGALYFLEQEEGGDRICRLAMIPYADMHVPYQGVRSTKAHHDYLTQLLAVFGKIKDVARVLDVRPDRAYALLERYQVDFAKYQVAEKPDPVPPELDFLAFKRDYEIEAFSTRELEEKYHLSAYRVYQIVDRRDLVEPTDQVKMIKRFERNPEHRNMRNKGIPRPSKARIEAAMKEGNKTLDQLGEKFKVSRLTVRDWLLYHGLKTKRMETYERREDVETSLYDVVYDEVIRKKTPLEIVAQTQGISKTTVWRIASGYPEWEDVKGTLRLNPTSFLEFRRVYLSVKEKRMTKKQACRVLGVSFNTLKKQFEAYEKKGDPYAKSS